MLTNKEKQSLKAKAHKLKPVVMIGAKGLTDAVLEEIMITFDAHELIKIKVTVGDKAIRTEMIHVLVKVTDAELIAIIGNIAIVYKKHPAE